MPTRPDADPPAIVTVPGPLAPECVGDILQLLREVTEADGVAPISEHVALHLRSGGDTAARHLLARHGDVLAGYAHLDPTDAVDGAVAELAVRPSLRRRGVGTALVSAALESAPGGRLRLWAHGDAEDARALAARLGFREVRRLLQLRRPLLTALPAPELPDGVRLRAFRPGTDDAAWLRLNAAAFADHPEQGAWTAEDLRLRTAESWFDPAGFLLAVDEAEDLAGFVWTKVHGSAPEQPHGHDPLGEIYVVAVDPAWAGHRLGRALTLAGLHWLRRAGLAQAMLYVDAGNTRAVALYESLGLTVWGTDVMFSRQRAG